MDYPKSVPGVGLVNGKFVDENQATGQVGSLIPSAWGNAVTDEIMAVLAEGGVAAVEGNNSQLKTAIKNIITASSIAWSKITGKPTTLSGYGISDGLKIGDHGVGGNLVTFTGDIDDAATVPLGWCFVAAAGGTTGTLPSVYGILRTVGFRDDQMLQIFSIADGVAGKTTAKLFRTGMPGRPGGSWGPWAQYAVRATTLEGYGITDGLSNSDMATQEAAETGASVASWMNPLRVIQAIRSSAAAASEALSGALRVATQAEVAGGVLDDVAVTPKKLRGGSAVSLGPTGHIALPEWLGGFALCWGRIQNSGAGTSYTFSRAFTELYGVITSSDANFTTSLELLQASAMTSTGFTAYGAIINPQATSNVPGWYLAYGK